MAQYNPPESKHLGTGVETVFGFTWPYLKASDVYVSVDGDPASTVLVGTAQVSLQPAPALGAVVRIYRDTPAQAPYYLFDRGIPFMPRYVDTNNRQLLHAVQEGLLEFAAVKEVAEEALLVANAALAEAQAAKQLATSANANSRRALRVPASEATIRELPSQAARSRKILGFNDIGEPVGVIPVSGSAAEVLLDLASNADRDLGAGMVGRYGGGTVQDSLDRLELRHNITQTYTVGPGGDYATLRECLRVVSLRHRPVYTGTEVSVQVKLLSGYVMREQVLLYGGMDLSWVLIVAEAAAVEIDPSAILIPLSQNDDLYPAFGAKGRSKLPTIGCLFRYPSNIVARDGVGVISGSSVAFLPEAGVNYARRGLCVFYKSDTHCYMLGLTQGGDGTGAGLARGAQFKNARLRAMHLAYSSTAGMARSDFSQCEGDIAVYSIWGSMGDVYQSNASQCAGTAFLARDGASLNCRETNASHSTRSYHALHNGRINARSRITGPTMIWIGDGAQYAREYGVLASGNSSVEASELNASHCTGSAAISASDASSISFIDGVATDAANRAVWSQNCSSISAVRTVVSDSRQGYVAESLGLIAASNGVARNCAEFGALARDGGSIALSDVDVSLSRRGLESRDGGKLTARRVIAVGCLDRAASAIDGGEINVQGGDLRDAGSRGLTARNGGRIMAVDCDVSGAGNWAAEVLNGSTITFNGGNPGSTALSQAANVHTADGVIYASVAPGPGPGSIELIAHRGYAGEKPQSTPVAFNNAVARGADALETDIAVSADGVLYTFHDTTVDSLTTGTGTFTALTSAYLDTLEIKAGIGTGDAPLRLGKFNEYLAIAKAAKRKIYPELKRLRSTADIATCVQAVVDVGLDSTCCMCSFNDSHLAIVRELNTRMELGAVTSSTDPVVLRALVDRVARLGRSIIVAEVAGTLANPDVVAYARTRGVGWACWTVNDAGTAVALRNIGVRSYISDYHLTIPPEV